jgi:hypothetical protein
MQYQLQIARRRPQGGVDTENIVVVAANEAAAIARASVLTEQLLGGQPGVAVLSHATLGIIWSHRHKMPPVPPY